MQTMECFTCAMKHLAGAAGYLEEITAGHGANAELDHRMDLHKDLVHAERHLHFLDEPLAAAVRNIRKRYEDSGYQPSPEIRNLIGIAWRTIQQKTTAPAAVPPPSVQSVLSVPSVAAPPTRKPCGTCGKRPAVTPSVPVPAAQSPAVNPGSAGRQTGLTPLAASPSSFLFPLSSAPQSVQSVPSVFDLVLPLADSSAAAPELRYALRSAAKNLRGLGRIFIVSKNLPAWLDPQQVTHVPCNDRAGWKDFNLIKKLLAACDAGVSEQFIFWSDDQFLMQPVDAASLMPMHEGDAGTWTPEQWTAKFNSKPATCWWNRLQNTVKLLQSKGKTAWNFDSHHPTLYNRDQFKQLMQELDVLNESKHPAHGYTINTLYCNLAGYTPATSRGLARCANCLPKPDTTFWNANEPKAWPTAEKYLKATFPTPSPWEIPAVNASSFLIPLSSVPPAVPSQSVPSVKSVPSVAAPGSQAVPSVPLTALTCTGDRPVQFGICMKIMERMNPRPSQWLIVDDGKTPIAPELIPNWAQYIRREPQPGDPPMTLAKNILAGFEHLKYNTVAFIEDDDWYPLNYLAEQFKEAQGVEACGAAGRYYFQLVKNAASVFTRGFSITASLLLNSAEAVKTYRQVCIDQPDGNGLDVLFWRRFNGKKKLHSNISATSVGIKDWPAGRGPGFAPTHVSSKGFMPDPQRKYLRQWLPPLELTWYNPENLK